jgi:hypothetical protein
MGSRARDRRADTCAEFLLLLLLLLLLFFLSTFLPVQIICIALLLVVLLLRVRCWGGHNHNLLLAQVYSTPLSQAQSWIMYTNS